MPEPRCVHYNFAHVALRGLALADPEFARALWELDDPASLLDEVAVRVARACRARGEGGDLSAAALKVHKHGLGRHSCVVIELPEPLATTEAFMVAIVALRDADDGEAGGRRYFTLEFSEHREAPQTVLGEWTEQGSHLNMGGGPEPTVDAFVAELARFVLD